MCDNFIFWSSHFSCLFLVFTLFHSFSSLYVYCSFSAIIDSPLHMHQLLCWPAPQFILWECFHVFVSFSLGKEKEDYFVIWYISLDSPACLWLFSECVVPDLWASVFWNGDMDTDCWICLLAERIGHRTISFKKIFVFFYLEGKEHEFGAGM